MYLIGEFRETDQVASAIRTLRAGGIAPVDLDLFSEEPVELPRGLLDRPSRMSLASVLGALVVGAAATLFVYWAQHNYRLVTGGMPVFSWWATGVITYEMTMLGAVVTAFGWFLWESGLIRKGGRTGPVPEVAPGSICVRVRCSVEHSGRALEAMRRAGAIDVERGGDD